MKIVHKLRSRAIKKEGEGSFLLTNKAGSFLSLGSSKNITHMQGWFHPDKNFNVYKTIENIFLDGEIRLTGVGTIPDNWAETKLLIKSIDETDGIEDFIDSSDNEFIITNVSNVEHSRDITPQFGDSAIKFIGVGAAGNYLQIAHTDALNIIATQLFTAELWIYYTTMSGVHTFIAKGGVNNYKFEIKIKDKVGNIKKSDIPTKRELSIYYMYSDDKYLDYSEEKLDRIVMKKFNIKSKKELNKILNKPQSSGKIKREKK